jgi:hypothetical protein
MVWAVLAAQGATGAQGIVYRQTWSSSTVYSIGDGITYNGTRYIALASNQNISPGTDQMVWAVFAAAGGIELQTPQQMASRIQKALQHAVDLCR